MFRGRYQHTIDPKGRVSVPSKYRDALAMYDAEVRRAGRLYISHAKEVDLDGAGRILLPSDSRVPVGIVKDVTLVGIGRRFFEIWDRTRFEEYERLNGDGGMQSGFERLAQLGVK